jgi:hypothetical protein
VGSKGNALFLIALSGGDIADRELITDRLVMAGKARLAGFAMNPPVRRDASIKKQPPLDGASRGARLAEAITGLESRPAVAGGLVVVHCLTPEEADLVRESGGEVWHVYGAKPSALVPIRRPDRMVTTGENGFAHVLSPLEALSEYLMVLGLAARSTVQRRARA